MNDYEARKEARIERYRDREANARKRSGDRFQSARDATAGIPPGQPILVGHHSEKRHRAALDKHDRNMRKGIEENGKADYWAGRADSAESNTSISNDDPDAIEKLRATVAELEAKQENMKATNRALRKNDTAALHGFGLSDSTIAKLQEGDCCGRKGFPDYALANNRQNLKRYKVRLEELESRQERTERDPETVGGVTIRENLERGSLEIDYPDKPTEALRGKMKAYGFRWARTSGVWYKRLNTKAIASWWGKAREWAEMYRQAVEINPDDPATLSATAEAILESGDLEGGGVMTLSTMRIKRAIADWMGLDNAPSRLTWDEWKAEGYSREQLRQLCPTTIAAADVSPCVDKEEVYAKCDAIWVTAMTATKRAAETEGGA